MTWIDWTVLIGIVALIATVVLLRQKALRKSNTTSQQATHSEPAQIYVADRYAPAHIPAEGDPCSTEGCDGKLELATNLMRIHSNGFDSYGEALWCPKCQEQPVFGS
ncbi:MAG: hypothetical protein RI947_528 [Candidatus Parcubacteria bacterium]|jgi:cytochrome c-type biogenesis protein CcmH/NrfF